MWSIFNLCFLTTVRQSEINNNLESLLIQAAAAEKQSCYWFHESSKGIQLKPPNNSGFYCFILGDV